MNSDPSGPSSELEVSRRELPEVRSELRRLGYLDHQVERYLLQDVLKPERPLETLAHLTLKVGLLIGLPAALLAAVVLAAANGLLRRSPFDILPLLGHLLPPMILGPALSFALLGGLLALFLRWTHMRRIETASLGLAMVATAVAVLVAVQQVGRPLWLLPRWQALALVGFLPFFAYLVFKVSHGGLLTLAIRLTDSAPERPSSSGRWVVPVLVVVTLLLLVPAVLEVEKHEEPETGSLPVARGERVVVLGIDGVLARELDYLVAGGELPGFAELVAAGVTAEYPRNDESPIAFWATVATGQPSDVHGLESLDAFRPAGVSRPLRRNGWLRHYWALGAHLGWVEYRPVLANSRRAWSFWELAGRGGARSSVVGWWGTFPVEPIPGSVVAHGGYGLLLEGSSLAVHPPEDAEALRDLAESLKLPAEHRASLELALPAETAREIIREAVLPDHFYLEVLRRRLKDEPRTAALYLAGLDIAAEKADLGPVAHGDLIRRRLRSVDALLAELTASPDGPSVMVVVDPGRRGGGQGRAYLWRPAGCEAGARVATRPEVLGATLMRLLGLPQSRELPAPMDGCDWPRPSMVMDGYGPRRGLVPAGGEGESEEYLENLRSLGYL